MIVKSNIFDIYYDIITAARHICTNTVFRSRSKTHLFRRCFHGLYPP